MWDLIVSVPDHCLSFYFGHDIDDYLKNAFHLFAENRFGNEHNDNFFSQMPGEKVVTTNILAKECSARN